MVENRKRWRKGSKYAECTAIKRGMEGILAFTLLHCNFMFMHLEFPCTQVGKWNDGPSGRPGRGTTSDDYHAPDDPQFSSGWWLKVGQSPISSSHPHLQNGWHQIFASFIFLNIYFPFFWGGMLRAIKFVYFGTQFRVSCDSCIWATVGWSVYQVRTGSGRGLSALRCGKPVGGI